MHFYLHIEEYLAADMKLYNHFKSKFEQKINDFGEENMKREVNKHNNYNNWFKVNIYENQLQTVSRLCLFIISWSLED